MHPCGIPLASFGPVVVAGLEGRVMQRQPASTVGRAYLFFGAGIVLEACDQHIGAMLAEPHGAVVACEFVKCAVARPRAQCYAQSVAFASPPRRRHVRRRLEQREGVVSSEVFNHPLKNVI